MFVQSYFLEKHRDLAQRIQATIEAPASMRFDAGFDMSMSRENPTIAAYDWARFQMNDEEDLIDKETWDELYARPDTEWYEGITQYQAEAIRDEYDYNIQHEAINKMSTFNASNIGGYFAGALLDPLNFLPWTRFMAGTLKLATKGTSALAKMGRGTEDIVNAVTGSAVGEVAIYKRKHLHQTEYDMTNAVLNVAMAGAIGAGVAGMRKVASNLKNNSIEENIAMAGKSMDDTANGQQVSVDGGAPPRQQVPGEADRKNPLDKLKQDFEREVDLIIEEPTVKAVATQVRDMVKKAPRAVSDFFNCRIK